MEACLTKCFNGIPLLRSLKPQNLKLTNSVCRSSSMAIHSGRKVLSSYCSPKNELLLGGAMSVEKAYDALLLDAGGTLLQLAEPVEEIYASIGRKYGLTATPAEVKQGFKRAFAAPWPEKLRYQGDGRPFWKLVVSEATGSTNQDYFEEVYEYYANGDAWRLPVGAYDTISLLKCIGVKVAVVSNFDTRLRELLKDLNIFHLFDSVIVSSEVGYEKPDPKIFHAALDEVNVRPGRAVHVGDDLKADKEGANAIGMDCWLWGTHIKTFTTR